MRVRDITCNKEYKSKLMTHLHLCCTPHKGCNRINRDRWTPHRNWKKYRNYQWKEKIINYETFFG